MQKKTLSFSHKSTADVPHIEKGRQYHIGLKKGDVAPYIILCGDPARVKKAAGLLSDPCELICHREYVTVTGKYYGVPVSVMATGMGPDNTEIAVVELSQIVENPTFMRVGTSGALQDYIKISDIVISSGSVRMENTSSYFVSEGYPALAHHEVILALLKAAQSQKIKSFVGITATAPGFYGAQGRNTPFFKPRYPNIVEELSKMNVLNLEMESSALFTLSSLAGHRAGAICGIVADRDANKFIDKEALHNLEIDSLKLGLNAVKILAAMDKKRGKNKYWVP